MFILVELWRLTLFTGNYYGTPKPLESNNLSLTKPSPGDSESVCLPGLHPSSEGKRRRNRSNVEAMSAKDMHHDEIVSNNQVNRKSKAFNNRSFYLSYFLYSFLFIWWFVDDFSSDSHKKSPPSYYYDSNLKYSDLEDDQLGPLPPKWEKAYTESGEVYFIE